MDTTAIIRLKSPPLPYVIEAVQIEVSSQTLYPARANIGVFKLIYVRKGMLEIVEDSHSFTLKSGEYLVIRPDSSFAPIKSDKQLTVIDEIQFSSVALWEEVGVAHSPKLFGDYYSHILHIKKMHRVKNKKSFESIVEKIRLASENGEATAFWDRQQHFVTLLKRLDEEWRQSDAKATLVVAEKAAAYIKRHYMEQVTNLLLAKAVGYHINYIARCMDEVYSMTPQQYLTYYRIDQAKLMLVRTENTIADIAHATGFKQTPHFSRLFSDYVGVAPLRYRKKYSC